MLISVKMNWADSCDLRLWCSANDSSVMTFAQFLLFVCVREVMEEYYFETFL